MDVQDTGASHIECQKFISPFLFKKHFHSLFASFFTHSHKNLGKQLFSTVTFTVQPYPTHLIIII